MVLRPYQEAMLRAIEGAFFDRHKNRLLIQAATGCHAKGQGILMFSGRIKAVEDIDVGDAIMGPDNRPRIVLDLVRGHDEMVRIVPVKGNPWIVNIDHILTLQRTNKNRVKHRKDGQIVDVSVREWLTWGTTAKHLHKLFRRPATFSSQPVEIDPYILGLLLGDGSMAQSFGYSTEDPETLEAVTRYAATLGLRLHRMSPPRQATYIFKSTEPYNRSPLTIAMRRLGLLPIASKDRFVPSHYKRNSESVRLEVLAGLIDSDGASTGGGFEYSSISKTLSDDVAFLARSLGLAAYITERTTKSQNGVSCLSYRVGISGDCSGVPCRIPRKRASARCQKKDVLRTGFSIEPFGLGEYYGFSLDGDGRYLLDDFTVTHNTGKTVSFAALTQSPRMAAWLQQYPRKDRTVLVIAHREELLDQAAEKIHAANRDLVVAIEQADSYAGWNADVVVASIQTLVARKCVRLKRLMARQRFRVVIVDECHRSAAPSYRTVLAHLGFLPMADTSETEETDVVAFEDVAEMEQALKGWDAQAPTDQLLVGFTATPNRSDSIGLGCVFQEIAYSYGIKPAIDDKWLVPVVSWAIETKTSLENVRISRGDFNQKDLGEAVNESRRNDLAVSAWHQHAPGRPTLAFTVSVAHAHALAEAFCRSGVQAAPISGETPREVRAQLLRDFRSGRMTLLANAMLLTEGVDLPMVSCILHAKPTKSATLYTQMCLDAETEILGEQGWIGIDDRIVGKVAAFCVSDATVRWSEAERMERQRGSEMMWGIESPHLNLRVTGGHRMVTRTRREDGWRIRSAEGLPQEFKIPLCGTLEINDADVSDEDLTLLGLILTDGNVNRINGQVTLYQSECYPEVIGLIRETLRRVGVKYGHSIDLKPSNFGPRAPLHRWTISHGAPRGRDSHLRGWGYLDKWVSHTGKTLTQEYDSLSKRQMGVLLKAMHAGDGVKSISGNWTPRSMSICGNHRLLDQVQALAVVRGFRCNKSELTDRLAMLHISENRPDWSVVTTADDGRPVWCVMPSRPNERVWCVSVVTGAIIVRRHGKVAIVGNSGRGLRLDPSKRDCILIDLVDVSRRHSLQTAGVLYGLPPSLALKGQDLRQVEKRLQDLQEKHPGFTVNGEGRLTLEQLEAAAVRVDLWTVRPMTEFVSSIDMDWIRTGDDAFRLQYPWEDGSETLVVEKDLLDRFTVTASVRHRDVARSSWVVPPAPRVMAQGVSTAVEALRLAEAFVAQERASVMRLKDRDAAWKRKPASPKQIAFLRRIGAPVGPKMTMGDASRLIDTHNARRGR